MQVRLRGSGTIDDPIRLDVPNYEQLDIRPDGSIDVLIHTAATYRAVADVGRAGRLRDRAALDELVELAPLPAPASPAAGRGG